jgi:lactam utilization protein B
MKKLLILFAALVFAVSSHAQDTAKSKSTTMGKSSHMKDCYMMKNGKMVMEKNGTTTDMTQDVTLSNGTMVMKDGTVKTKDGKTVTLKDGECVYTDGRIKTMSSSSKTKSPQ